jgi:hypothetical protein
MYAETLSHYRIRKGLIPVMAPPVKLAGKQMKYAGLESRKIEIKSEVESMPDLGGVASGSVVRFDFYVSEPVNLPNGELNFLATFYGMPNYGGIPLACHQVLKTGKETRTWYTESVKRKLLPSSLFEDPVGYTRVKNSALVNDGLRAKFDEFAKDMKVGIPFGQ